MLNVNWEEFLAQHDLVYERAGDTWRDGLPLGNGALGALAYAPFHPEFVINKNDVYDYRTPPRRRLTHQEVLDLMAAGGTAFDLEHMETPTSTQKVTPKTCGILRIKFGNDSTWTGGHLISQRLSLHDACLHTHLDKHMSHPRITSCIPRGKNVLVVRVCDVSWISSFHNRVELLWHPDAELEPPKLSAEDDRLILDQTLPDGLRYVMVAKVVLTGGDAWKAWMETHYRPQHWATLPETVRTSVQGNMAIAGTGGDFEVYLAVVTSLEADDPLAAATTLAEEAAADGYESLYAAHRQWWAAFWRQSLLKLDQPFLEQLWYFSLYQLASCYGVAPVPGLYGLWYGPDDEPSQHVPWGGTYTNDQNSEMPPMPLFAANHLELVESFYQTFNAMIPALQTHTKGIYDMDGIFFPCGCEPRGSDLMPGIYRYIQCGGPYQGLIYAWGYRFSQDRTRLQRDIYPFLREVCAFFADYMTFDAARDRYRLWPSIPPEIMDLDIANPPHTLSLLKVCMQQAMEAAELLDVDHELAARWRDILAKYPDYPVEHGIILEGEGAPWNHHASQYGGLYSVFPCGEYGVDSPPEIHALVRSTYDSFATRFTMRSYADTLGRNHFFNGWSWFFADMMALRMGWKREAWDLFWEQPLRCLLKPNGLFVHNAFLVADPAQTEANLTAIPSAEIMDGDEVMPLAEPMHANSTSEATPNWTARETVFPVLEMSSAYMTFINETLLQSYGGLIRIFPAVPRRFTGGFDRFRTEGAFLVSAWMSKGTTQCVVIESTVGGEMRLRNPWPEKTVTCLTAAGDVLSLAGEEICLTTQPGEQYTFYRREQAYRRVQEIEIGAERPAGPNVLQLRDGTIIWLGKPDFYSEDMQRAAYRLVKHKKP